MMPEFTPPPGSAKKAGGIRRWSRFSLSTLLLVTVLISLPSAWVTSTLNRVRQQRKTIAAIRAAGGSCDFEHEYDENGNYLPDAPLPGNWALRKICGQDAFTYIRSIEVCDGVDHATLALIARQPRLRNLEISVYDTQVSAAALAELRQAKTLKVLSVRFDCDLSRLREIQSLEHLELYGTRISAAGLASLGRLKHLRSLSVDEDENFNDKTMANIAACKNLEALSLLNTGVAGRGLAHLRGHRTLETLRMNQPTDLNSFHPNDQPTPGTGLGAPISQLPALKELDLTASSIGDGDLKHLAKCSKLVYLNLDFTSVSDAGMVHVGKLSQLHTLILTNTRVASLSGLRGLSKLRYMEVRAAVSEKQAREFHRELPLCTISCHDQGVSSPAFDYDIGPGIANPYVKSGY